MLVEVAIDWLFCEVFSCGFRSNQFLNLFFELRWLRQLCLTSNLWIFEMGMESSMSLLILSDERKATWIGNGSTSEEDWTQKELNSEKRILIRVVIHGIITNFSYHLFIMKKPTRYPDSALCFWGLSLTNSEDVGSDSAPFVHMGRWACHRVSLGSWTVNLLSPCLFNFFFFFLLFYRDN